MEYETEEHPESCLPCHRDPSSPPDDPDPIDDYNYKGIQDSVTALLDTLRTQLFAAKLIDADGHPYSGRGVPDGDGRTGWVGASDSAGAVWNYLMAEEDQSHGVHNAKYIIGLLTSAIRFMEPGPPPVSRENTVAKGRKEKDVGQ
jgi:hypothetical protein